MNWTPVMNFHTWFVGGEFAVATPAINSNRSKNFVELLVEMTQKLTITLSKQLIIEFKKKCIRMV
jgi:hypothetical protein